MLTVVRTPSTVPDIRIIAAVLNVFSRSTVAAIAEFAVLSVPDIVRREGNGHMSKRLDSQLRQIIGLGNDFLGIFAVRQFPVPNNLGCGICQRFIKDFDQ